MGGSAPQTPWDLALFFSRMDGIYFSGLRSCRTLERLDRRIGQRRDATRAPIQARNGWRPAGRLLVTPPHHLRMGKILSNLWGPPQEMEPYCRYLMAAMMGKDVAAELEAIRQLPLEKRYLWRVISALKWGFADFDTANVAVDKLTLDPGDFAQVMDLLKLRPIQFCLLMASLIGPEQMERTMLQAIGMTKQGG